jgi:hypothetical protein
MKNTPNLEFIIEKLQEFFVSLNEEQILVLARAAHAMHREVQAIQHSELFLSKNAFSYVTTRLVSHHSTSSRPLAKENFEHAIEDVFRNEGRHVPISTDPTKRGADVMVDGVRYSLKTFSSQGNVPLRVDISKFAESRWMRQALILENFESMLTELQLALSTHLNEYDYIFMLHNHRHNKNNKEHVTYYLYEIPKNIFNIVNSINADKLSEMYYIEKEKRAGIGKIPQSVTARLMDGSEWVGNVSLDGSVEKLRFMSLAISKFNLHAEWDIQVGL